jgi:REP element-mobilizing transposase RayT
MEGMDSTPKFQAHGKRESFSGREPLHLTLRLRPGLPSLRRKDIHRALRSAVLKARGRGLAVAQFAFLSNHIHLIVESPGKQDLGRAMQSFGISFGKRLNAILERTGAVFTERYHRVVLKTPTQVRNALKYVLANEFQHGGGKGRVDLDGCSSALLWPEVRWERLLGSRWRRMVGFPERNPEQAEREREHVLELISAPRTWLLKAGWARARAA